VHQGQTGLASRPHIVEQQKEKNLKGGFQPIQEPKVLPQAASRSRRLAITMPVMLADLCASKQGAVHFVDSQEMLQQLPDAPHIHKWPGRYPETPALFEALAGKVDSIIVYSVVQYVFAEGNLWDFIDRCLMLLNDGGEIFIGDIPNITMRKRFFSGNEGVSLHKQFTGRNELPNVQFNQLETGRIDDSVVLAILARARSEGYHAWVIPQGPALPMANRREDILIRKP
jgi:hypothetical protein